MSEGVPEGCRQDLAQAVKDPGMGLQAGEQPEERH